MPVEPRPFDLHVTLTEAAPAPAPAAPAPAATTPAAPAPAPAKFPAPTPVPAAADGESLAEALAQSLLTMLRGGVTGGAAGAAAAAPLAATQVLAAAMELAERRRGLTGAQKKNLVIRGMRRLAQLAAADDALAGPVGAAAMLASAAIDVVVAATKAPAAGPEETRADVFAAFEAVRAAAAAERARGGLTPATAARLLPVVVTALTGLRAFAAATKADQLTMGGDLVAQLSRDAGDDSERAAWAVVAAGLPLALAALHAAKAGDLSVNRVAAEVDPGAAAAGCGACLVACLTAVAARRGREH